MEKSDHYFPFIPEPGISYFTKNDSFIFWEGFFDELFKAISKAVDYKDYPIEFKNFNDLTGWKDDNDVAITINPKYTLQVINLIDLNNIAIGKKFISDLKIFLQKNLLNKVEIQDYW